MTRQIAFLRGINVGGHRRVGMADLRDLLTDLGYGDVRTYLQSGNVVLTSRAAARRVERELEQQIAAGLGVDLKVLVRTRAELAGVIERDPFGDVAVDPSRYLVSFLSTKPDAAVVRELARVDVAPAQFVVSGREIYAWHPDGMGRSELSKLLSEQRIGVTMTGRNWNTLTKLLALADA
jgi:uncharacterized protein (DUF1697 family)